MINLFVAGALLVAQATSTAPAPPAARPCVTRQQVSDIAVAVLPFIIEGARHGCGAYLPATSFLMGSGGADLMTALRGIAAQRRHEIATAFRIISNNQMPRGMSDQTVIQSMGESLTGEFVGTLDAQSCRNIDQVLEAVSPLSPERIGHLLAAFFGLATARRHVQTGADGGNGAAETTSDLEICPA